MSNPDAGPRLASNVLATALGYRIVDESTLTDALTHGSYASEHPGSADYQRLEFLGDAVLQVAVTRHLYERFPEASEGEMTLIRAGIVSEPALASVASRWGIAALIRLGRGEELTGGRSKPSILSDVVESLLAVVYLEAGLDHVDRIVAEHWGPLISERVGASAMGDPKTRLQEVLAASGRTVEYTVTETGPQHAREFTATAHSSGDAMATGVGTSKKRAEQAAARAALKELRGDA